MQDFFMDKFKCIYRIPSARLASWDYSSPGLYFITICTRGRINSLGEIKENEMYLSLAGKIANEKWTEIPNHFSHVLLGEFVIMPNHLHGIINIEKRIVETGHALSLQPKEGNINPDYHYRFRNQGKGTVSAIVGSFKSAVTKQVHPFQQNFEWQTRFHDHIIRNHDEYIKISQYILNNPANWTADKFNKS